MTRKAPPEMVIKASEYARKAGISQPVFNGYTTGAEPVPAYLRPLVIEYLKRKTQAYTQRILELEAPATGATPAPSGQGLKRHRAAQRQALKDSFKTI